MAIPLNKKLYFSVYGNYTLDKKTEYDTSCNFYPLSDRSRIFI